MDSLLRPGLVFGARDISVPNNLERTASTYSYGPDFEVAPKNNDIYVICLDGSVQSVYEPTRPIGWELLDIDGQFYFRVKQVNFSPKLCDIIFVRNDPDPPQGRNACYSREVAFESQEAYIIDFEDDGEPEVTSRHNVLEMLTPPGSP